MIQIKKVARFSDVLTVVLAVLSMAVDRPSRADGGISGFLTAPANPIQTTASVDTSIQASALIRAESGGTVELTDSNGNRFKLVLPPQALVQDTEITLNALKDLGAESEGTEGTLAGVKILPDGLTFYRPVELVVTTKDPVQLAKLVPFQFQNAGEDLTASPFRVDSDHQVTLRLWHLSGHGVVHNSRLESKIYQSPTKSERDRLGTVISHEIKEAALGHDVGRDQLLRDLDTFFKTQVLPPTQSFNTCQMAQDSIRDLYEFQRDIITHFDEDFYNPLTQAQLTDIVERAMALCNDEARRLCLQHKVNEFTYRYYEIQRSHILLGEAIPKTPGELELDALDSKCMHFDYKMETSFEPQNGMPGQKFKVSTHYTIHAPHASKVITTGPSEIAYDSFTLANFEELGCTMQNLVLTTDQQKVVQLDFGYNPKMLNGDVTFAFLPGQPTAAYLQVCKQPDGQTTTDSIGPVPLYSGFFSAFHGPTSPYENEFSPYYNAMLIRKWDMIGADSLFARKVYQRSYVRDTIHEDSSFVLVHQPQL